MPPIAIRSGCIIIQIAARRSAADGILRFYALIYGRVHTIKT